NARLGDRREKMDVVETLGRGELDEGVLFVAVADEEKVDRLVAQQTCGGEQDLERIGQAVRSGESDDGPPGGSRRGDGRSKIGGERRRLALPLFERHAVGNDDELLQLEP